MRNTEDRPCWRDNRNLLTLKYVLRFTHCYTRVFHDNEIYRISDIKVKVLVILYTLIGLHMGPNYLRYVARQFYFSLCHHVTFYKSLTSLSTVFIKAYVGLLQLLKWPCRTSFFTHVEPYWCRCTLFSLTFKITSNKNTQIYSRANSLQMYYMSWYMM